ncbi:MAG TPA: hypothetical protein VN442_26140 [Bryobacteraceae bacterium]|nr:hypothetical protein [Bryobacteraceae bacterium]
MSLRATRAAAGCAVFAANLILFSCASGPRPPEKGTPAFFWTAAKESYATADYLKTVENLEKVVSTENEFAAAARPWLLIMTSGLTQGYMEAADFFESGARVNKADPTTFRKQVSQNRGAAGRMSLRFAEVFGTFQKTTDDPVVLAFPFPTGSAAQVGLLVRVGNGILPQASEIDSALKSAVSRAVLLTTCRAAGSPDDSAKARELFKSGEVKVPRGQFILAMADAMHDSAALYGRNKLDEPQKMMILCTRAEEALKSVPASKESKELLLKIQATLKKNKT